MKTGFFLSLAALGIQLASALPHVNHRHRRDILTATEWITIEAPTEIVYVEQDGDTLSVVNGDSATTAPLATSATQAPVNHAATTTSVSIDASQISPPASLPAPAEPAPQAASTSAFGIVQTQAQSAAAPSSSSSAAPASLAAPAPADLSQSSGSSTPDDASGFGISWSPYTTKGGPCKGQEQANSDFAQMSGYGSIRIYGTDCDQTNIAIKAAKATGKKIFAGVFDLNSAASEATLVVNAVKENGGDWSIIDTVSVGNEDVGNKGASVSSVQQAMSAASSNLRGAGYTGPIVHVDTVAAYINPATADALCSPDAAGDYLAANIHAFFDPNTDAAAAGAFLQTQIKLLDACANHRSRKRGAARIRVTETGWPKQGQVNGHAVPSDQNQVAAVQAIRNAVPNADLLFFSAFDAQWQDPGYLGVEPFWGILDNPLH